MSKLFKNALFGYRKKDVNEYIEQISTDFTQKLAEKDAEIDDLKSQRTKLDEMRAKLEKEKAAVSDAIVSAHEEGERIIAAAREKAAEIRQDTERKTTAENSMVKTGAIFTRTAVRAIPPVAQPMAYSTL